MYGITRAPAIDRPGLTWFNVDHPLGLDALRGKIVILDFWTSCCINCLHVIPTLRQVEDAFPDDVAVIGVHSPKFTAERDGAALRHAIARHDVRHPVVHDPDMMLWDEYCVKAWPTLVLLSPQGHVIGQVSGEPDPERLLQGIGEMVRSFRQRGELTPGPLPLSLIEAPSGALRFPGKIKALPRNPDGPWRAARWAVADAGHHQIVLLTDDGDTVARIGTGSGGFADGPPDAAAFLSPQGIAATADAVYVADTGNHALRRIDRAHGTVSTVGGTGDRGLSLRGSRDGRDTALASPWDVEAVGDLLVFANAGTHQLGTYDPDSGTVSLLAGTGGEALVDGPVERAVLAQPSGLCLDAAAGLLYFVDAETSAVRRLTLTGQPRVDTIVGAGLFDFGDDDGPLGEARLQHPLGLACFGRGLVVADTYNGRLRFIDLAGRSVHTIADPGFDCRPGGCCTHHLAEPAGVIVAGPNRLMVSDTNHHRILEYRLDTGRARSWFE